jgi:hypothetical protein
MENVSMVASLVTSELTVKMTALLHARAMPVYGIATTRAFAPNAKPVISDPSAQKTVTTTVKTITPVLRTEESALLVSTDSKVTTASNHVLQAAQALHVIKLTDRVLARTHTSQPTVAKNALTTVSTRSA